MPNSITKNVSFNQLLKVSPSRLWIKSAPTRMNSLGSNKLTKWALTRTQLLLHNFRLKRTSRFKILTHKLRLIVRYCSKRSMLLTKLSDFTLKL